MPTGTELRRVARAEQGDALFLICRPEYQTGAEFRQKRTMLNEIDGAPHAGGDHPNAIPRPVEHDRAKRRQMFGAHLSELG